MAGQKSSELRVALNGGIYVDDLSNPEPTNLTPPATATNLGYTTEDGATFSFSKETTDIPVWPSPEPGRILTTSAPKSVAFDLAQISRDTWLNTFGGEITEKDGLYHWEADDFATVTKRFLGYAEDGELKYLFMFRKAQQLAEIELQWIRSDIMKLANEWKALAPDDGSKAFKVITNDPAFAGSPQAVLLWKATTSYSLNDVVTLASGEKLKVTTAGTSGTTEPTAPASVGGTVTDGDVVWTRTA